MGKTYRIKEPRCWVVRWDDAPTSTPETDYFNLAGAEAGAAHQCDRGRATEFRSIEDAKSARRKAGVSFWWRIVRRGRVSP